MIREVILLFINIFVSFRLKCHVKEHILHVHLKYFEFVCEECGEKFRSKTHLERHLLKHYGVAVKLPCDYCEAWLYTRSALKQHVRGHFENPQKCTVCGKVSLNRMALSKHMRFMHGEHNKKCEICSKQLRTNRELKVISF